MPGWQGNSAAQDLARGMLTLRDVRHEQRLGGYAYARDFFLSPHFCLKSLATMTCVRLYLIPFMQIMHGHNQWELWLIVRDVKGQTGAKMAA